MTPTILIIGDSHSEGVGTPGQVAADALGAVVIAHSGWTARTHLASAEAIKNALPGITLVLVFLGSNEVDAVGDYDIEASFRQLKVLLGNRRVIAVAPPCGYSTDAKAVAEVTAMQRRVFGEVIVLDCCGILHSSGGHFTGANARRVGELLAAEVRARLTPQTSIWKSVVTGLGIGAAVIAVLHFGRRR
jgi:hypothetical protein